MSKVRKILELHDAGMATDMIAERLSLSVHHTRLMIRRHRPSDQGCTHPRSSRNRPSSSHEKRPEPSLPRVPFLERQQQKGRVA